MTRKLTFTARVTLPDDVFEQAEMLTALRGSFETFHGALSEATGGSAEVTHKVDEARAARVPRGTKSDGTTRLKPGRKPRAVQAVTTHEAA